ncbi:MAG TPA: aminotransferase class V-fold PLP-dependent enzyme, partial [Gemmatimonadales bacterium]
ACRLAGLRNRLAERLTASLPDLIVTAERAERVPHILNVWVPGADSGALLMHLDLAGIAVSSGSACTSGATDPSPVLVAMGIPASLAACALRLSLGRETTEPDIDRVAEVFPGIVAKVRALAGVMARA